MKITLSDLHNLVQAFGALGGRQVEASDGDRKVLLLKPYEIDGKARYAIAKMKRTAREHMEAIDAEREALVAKHGPDALAINSDPVKTKAFKADMTKFLEQSVDFAEHRILVVWLNIGTNQMDPGLLEALLPVLDGDI